MRDKDTVDEIGGGTAASGLVNHARIANPMATGNLLPTDPNQLVTSNRLSLVVGPDEHKLRTTAAGKSQIEILAHRLESRRAGRIEVSAAVRAHILHACRRIAKRCGTKSKIPRSELLRLRDEARRLYQEQQQHPSLSDIWARWLQCLGFFNEKQLHVECYERAVIMVDEYQESDWFYFQDFIFYHTVAKNPIPIMRTSFGVSVVVVLLFYLATPIFFCNIVHDEQVCPEDPVEGKNRPYYGWLTSLYFASATLSTVGYGDVNVEKEPRSRTFYGAVYMIVAVIVAITTFGAVAKDAFSGVTSFFGRNWQKFANYVVGKPVKGELLYKRVRRIRFTLMMEIILQFNVLVLIGVVVAQFVASNNANEARNWDWMESFYWAIQTTTTIGYGDMEMPFNLRWFGVLYLTISTYFVGNALGRLASMDEEITKISRQYAWNRREVNKGLIYEMRSHDEDKIIDQYEFALASLLILGTISSDDLIPIMNKFRALATEDGYISLQEMDEVPDSSRLAELMKDDSQYNCNNDTKDEDDDDKDGEGMVDVPLGGSGSDKNVNTGESAQEA